MSKPISILILLLAGCQSGSHTGTCDEAIDHMAALTVERRGSALPEAQRARHGRALSGALDRHYKKQCSNDDSALIECVLEASDPATAQSCWRK